MIILTDLSIYYCLDTKGPMSYLFKPAWWLPGPHLQTIWPALCRRKKTKLDVHRERFWLADGDFVDLDWIGHPTGPIVLILHGLEGSIKSPYAKGMLEAVAAQGWRGVLMHFRGCSGVPNRLARGYHSGETGDVNEVIQALRSREPSTFLAAIGFSLGGNVLLKWLGETGLDNPLAAAVAISVPFELQKTTDRIRKGFSRVYQWHLLNCLYKRLSYKFQLQPYPHGLPPLSKYKSIRDFDDNITAPLHGFSNANEYYTLSSSRQYLNKIQVPTLLLQSTDDPFMTKDIIPSPQEISPKIQLEVTQSGGHVGFVSGKFPWRPNYWLEARVPAFLQSYLK